MRSAIGMALFLSIFLSLYLAVNGYVLTRLALLLGIKRNWAFYAVLAAVALSLVAAMILEAKIGNRLTGLYMAAATNWLGVLWILFWCLIAYEIVALGVKMNPRTAGIVVLAVAAVVTTYAIMQARQVRVSELKLPGPQRLRLVQMSDVHLSSVESGFLRRIVEQANALQPDAVLITGDMFDNHNEKTMTEIAALNELKAPVFFVSGNHETYTGIDHVVEMLRGTKVRMLRDEVVEFKGIQIAGIDDSRDRRRMVRVLKQLPLDGKKFVLLMYHRPEGLAAAAEAGVKLMLSGHTHQGQIFPFNFFVGIAYKYLSGRYDYNGTCLRVSSGTGTWGPRMRLGTESELVLVRLGDAEK
jgi:predicted MPP superfamily phosphohydrolase